MANCGAVQTPWVQHFKPHPRTALGHVTQTSHAPGQPWWSCQTTGWLHASARMGLRSVRRGSVAVLGLSPIVPRFHARSVRQNALDGRPKTAKVASARDDTHMACVGGGWLLWMTNTGRSPSIRRILALRGSVQTREGCSVGASPRVGSQGCSCWCVCLGRALMREGGSPAEVGTGFSGC